MEFAGEVDRARQIDRLEEGNLEPSASVCKPGQAPASPLGALQPGFPLPMSAATTLLSRA